MYSVKFGNYDSVHSVTIVDVSLATCRWFVKRTFSDPLSARDFAEITRNGETVEVWEREFEDDPA